MTISIRQLQQATGLDKDVVRKWEIRYGFPRPGRDSAGDRTYPEDQVVALRLIRRLLDEGMRPAKIVPLTLAELQALADNLAVQPDKAADALVESAIHALRDPDLGALRAFLERQIAHVGLRSFVLDKMPILNNAIGDLWLRGEVKIHEEHRYAAVVRDVLERMVSLLLPSTGGARVLLATPPDELHLLGLTMASAILGLAGATCINLGAQMPVAELCDAAAFYDADAVAMSLSLAAPPRKTKAYVTELSRCLRPRTAIWVGGKGALRLPVGLPRVTITTTFEDALIALEHLKRRGTS